MVPNARTLALVALAAMISACSSQGNSVSPLPAIQQPAIQQPQSAARSPVFAPSGLSQPMDIAQAPQPTQQVLGGVLASKTGVPMNITEPNFPLKPQSATATAGPPVYICDIHERIWRITTGTNAIKFIGNAGVLLTDLGIDPVNHVLYGISFTSLYKVSVTTGHATFVANLGISTANALSFAQSGLGFVAGENNTRLYDMSSSGVLGNFLSMSPFTSAGDITFYNGYIVVSGQDGSFNASEGDDLVFFNPATRRGVTYYTTPIKVLFGLYSTGTNQLYGLANTSLYYFDFSNLTIYLVKNFASAGVGQIYGAAYDGNFQN